MNSLCIMFVQVFQNALQDASCIVVGHIVQFPFLPFTTMAAVRPVSLLDLLSPRHHLGRIPIVSLGFPRSGSFSISLVVACASGSTSK